jgi:hypothetical protein
VAKTQAQRFTQQNAGLSLIGPHLLLEWLCLILFDFVVVISGTNAGTLRPRRGVRRVMAGAATGVVTHGFLQISYSSEESF